jgi:hypothetical protein
MFISFRAGAGGDEPLATWLLDQTGNGCPGVSARQSVELPDVVSYRRQFPGQDSRQGLVVICILSERVVPVKPSGDWFARLPTPKSSGRVPCFLITN